MNMHMLHTMLQFDETAFSRPNSISITLPDLATVCRCAAAKPRFSSIVLVARALLLFAASAKTACCCSCVQC